MKTIVTILFAFLFIFPAFAQDQIELKNMSFERTYINYETQKPHCCMGPKRWYNCGKRDLNTPDAQPGNFGVNLPAIDGDFYLGMVARSNDTWEGISQKLVAPLLIDEAYFFSIALAKSDSLESIDRPTNNLALYNKALKLRIWGANKFCEKKELLAESELINHTSWQYYEFSFEPKQGTYNYIMLEAFYKTPTLMPYNGNLLLDDCSPIIQKTEAYAPVIEAEKVRREEKLAAFDKD